MVKYLRCKHVCYNCNYNLNFVFNYVYFNRLTLVRWGDLGILCHLERSRKNQGRDPPKHAETEYVGQKYVHQVDHCSQWSAGCARENDDHPGQAARRWANTWLSYFVCEVRKVDGAFCPEKTLLPLVMGIQGLLNSQGVSVDFLNAVEFEKLRSVLDAEMKAISAKGIGLVRA